MSHIARKMWDKKLVLLLGISFSLLLVSCSKPAVYQKSALDELIKSKSEVQNFSVILYDMDYDDKAEKYKHQYQVLEHPKSNPDSLVNIIQPWAIVGVDEFKKYQEDMGMEIAVKKDGILKKQTAPAGYSEYVGNEKYGNWQRNSSGNSFWAFYGQYAFMSSIFRMSMYPVRYSYWNNYRGNYYNSGRAYYGHNGARSYGTRSSHATSRNNSRWNSRPSTFKQNVRSKVQRSSSARSSRSRTSSSRRSRSSSRYSSGSSSYRSRGGGFGK